MPPDWGHKKCKLIHEDLTKKTLQEYYHVFSLNWPSDQRRSQKLTMIHKQLPCKKRKLTKYMGYAQWSKFRALVIKICLFSDLITTWKTLQNKNLYLTNTHDSEWGMHNCQTQINTYMVWFIVKRCRSRGTLCWMIWVHWSYATTAKVCRWRITHFYYWLII